MFNTFDPAGTAVGQGPAADAAEGSHVASAAAVLVAAACAFVALHVAAAPRGAAAVDDDVAARA